jgi:protein-disulfide isomerase
MYRTVNVAFFLLLSLLAFSQQKPVASQADKAPAVDPLLPSEATVNSFLKQTFGYDDSVQWKIAAIKPSNNGLAEVDVILQNSQGQQYTRLFVTPDGKHAVVGDVIPFGAHPFEEARAELAKKANGPHLGPANAAITIVEFSDLQCPHCKDAQPAVDKLLAAHPDVRLVFQNFPLPSHNWAFKAASYADCAGRANNDAFWKFIHSVYEAQPQITEANADEKLTSLADAAGVKGADIAACAGKAETATRVRNSVELGRSVEVESTPTFFINGRRINNLAGLPPEFLDKLLAFHRAETK